MKNTSINIAIYTSNNINIFSLVCGDLIQDLMHVGLQNWASHHPLFPAPTALQPPGQY
jgi:hypothetical protein